MPGWRTAAVLAPIALLCFLSIQSRWLRSFVALRAPSPVQTEQRPVAHPMTVRGVEPSQPTSRMPIPRADRPRRREHRSGAQLELVPEEFFDFSLRTRELLSRVHHRSRHRETLDLQNPLSARPQTASAPGCPANCSERPSCIYVHVGSASTSYCTCPPGWTGEACERRDPSPCNSANGGRVLSRCAGVCDEDVNRCMCGDRSSHPGRPMRACYYDGVERDMPWLTPNWGGFSHGPRSHFWSGRMLGSTAGWCDASVGSIQGPLQKCSCYDGVNKGPLCEPSGAFCVNQCNGRQHGRCQNGYCNCSRGYTGIDCSIRVDGHVPADTEVSTDGRREREVLSTREDVAHIGQAHDQGTNDEPNQVAVMPRVYVY